jgi:hypothetical protein
MPKIFFVLNLSINVFPMSNMEYMDHESIFYDFIYDSIRPCSYGI